MSTKLTIVALVALSVSKLETELETNTYTHEELAEALALEQSRDEPRKTALEAIEGAMQPTTAPTEEAKAFCVPKGKSVTTKAGVKSDGQEVTADMVRGGLEKLKALKEKGLLV